MRRLAVSLFLGLLLAACGKTGTDSTVRQTPDDAKSECGAEWISNESGEETADVLKDATLGGTPHVTRFGSIWLAGQPGPKDWKTVREQGILIVIDLRNRNEDRGHDERSATEEIDLDYRIHPVRADNFARATVEPVLDAMDHARETGDGVLIHCATSNRSGALFAVWRYRQGDSLDDAIAAGKRAGMTSEEQNARDYINEHGR